MTSRHHRSASPRFQSIKAVFEQPDAVASPPSRPFSRASSPRTPTDDTPNPASKLISRETSTDQQETIDALLEISPTHRWPASREPQLRSKSSWIGPPPPTRLPSHTSVATMAQKVTITYSSPGLQPPVYITTSLSDPQWDLLEMDCSELPGGEREFVKTFHAEEGEYQYKFRLGPGDWWVCDEDKPTLDDGLGNRNNLLLVKNESSVKKTAAHSQHLADDVGELEPGPTFPHERDSSERNPKRDSLGDDVVGSKLAHDVKTEIAQTEHHPDDHHAPLFAHEQNGSPHRKPGVAPEEVPVNFSMDDDGDGDVEPSHYPQSPTFAHERDAPARVSTPGTDEDEDFMEEAPLMRHETLSPGPSERDHAPRLPHEHDNQHHDYDSDVLVSPVSASSAHLPEARNHIPAEADPNDPSLEKMPTHQEGILESLRRSSMRMARDEAMQDIITSTSPVTKTTSRSSSSPQSASLPSVLEDEEEPEEEPHKDSSATNTTSDSNVQGSEAGPHMLPERPAALITPPRTPDESKTPMNTATHLSTHHHKPAAEKDMHEEATHDVSHHKAKREHDRSKSPAKLTGLDGDAEVSKDDSKAASRPKTEDKSKGFFGGFFEGALGLGLTVLVGAGAAWLAFKMHDSIKDGGAALTS
ncbi:hypothetical protein Q7P37_008052 [Cladosporium fusiforme]